MELLTEFAPHELVISGVGDGIISSFLGHSGVKSVQVNVAVADSWGRVENGAVVRAWSEGSNIWKDDFGRTLSRRDIAATSS